MKREKIGYWDALTKEEIAEFLKEQVTCRLGMSVNDRPYVVPLAYVYHKGKIYLHWYGRKGIKDDYSKKNQRVCFEVDIYSSDHLFWKSIIAFGTLKKVDDTAERREVLEAFSRKFPELASGAGHPKFIKLLMAKGMGIMARIAKIYEVEVEEITGVFQDIKMTPEEAVEAERWRKKGLE